MDFMEMALTWFQVLEQWSAILFHFQANGSTQAIYIRWDGANVVGTVSSSEWLNANIIGTAATNSTVLSALT